MGTPRTVAVIAVHMHGTPCNITGIKHVSDQKGLYLIEDVAQAFGSSLHGKLMGTFGIVGMTSIGPSKAYNVGGQGGLVWTDDEQLAERFEWSIENGIAAWGGI